MKFTSKWPNPAYTVQAGITRNDVLGRPAQPPITVKFSVNEFDSELAQRQLRWTDEQRELAEQTLLEHAEFGQHAGEKGFWLSEAPPAMDNATVLAAMNAQHCSRTRITANGPEVCGRAVAEAAIYCLICLNEINASPAEVDSTGITARERTPEMVRKAPAQDAKGRFLPKPKEPIGAEV